MNTKNHLKVHKNLIKSKDQKVVTNVLKTGPDIKP
jgi:hypothetical protein